jgi:hypothetical protein
MKRFDLKKSTREWLIVIAALTAAFVLARMETLHPTPPDHYLTTIR